MVQGIFLAWIWAEIKVFRLGFGLQPKVQVQDLDYFVGSGPKGVDDLCFHIYGEFSPSSVYPPCRLPASRNKS